jgi:hypothetical protein
MGIQTGDISSKVGAALIELDRNARERGTVPQIADLDVTVDIGMCPACLPGRTRENRREHHAMAPFDDCPVENELLPMIREVLKDGGLANLNQICGGGRFFEIIVPNDMRERGWHAT